MINTYYGYLRAIEIGDIWEGSVVGRKARILSEQVVAMEKHRG